jgi:quercetin dioxygenase-like cupin family protein
MLRVIAGGMPMAFKCAIPAVPTVQQDDDTVRITRWDFEPGAVTGWHQHGWPYFVVMLTDAILNVDDGKNENTVSLKAGQSYSRPAGAEHDVMNGSSRPIAFVEIEVKRPDALCNDRRHTCSRATVLEHPGPRPMQGHVRSWRKLT